MAVPMGEITRALVGVRRRLCVKWGFVDMDVYEQEYRFYYFARCPYEKTDTTFRRKKVVKPCEFWLFLRSAIRSLHILSSSEGVVHEREVLEYFCRCQDAVWHFAWPHEPICRKWFWMGIASDWICRMWKPWFRSCESAPTTWTSMQNERTKQAASIMLTLRICKNGWRKSGRTWEKFLFACPRSSNPTTCREVATAVAAFT